MRRLKLKARTIRNLTEGDLSKAAGGVTWPCFSLGGTCLTCGGTCGACQSDNCGETNDCGTVPIFCGGGPTNGICASYVGNC